MVELLSSDDNDGDVIAAVVVGPADGAGVAGVAGDHADAYAPEQAQPASPSAPASQPHAYRTLLASPLYTSRSLRDVPANEEHDAALQAVSTGDENRQVAEVCGLKLRVQHMKRLVPGQKPNEDSMLNDELMNAWMAQLQARDRGWRATPGLYPACHFWNKLYKDEKQFNYENVRRWNKPVRLQRGGQLSQSVLDCELIFVPVHKPMHWVLAVIRVQDKVIEFFDSNLNDRSPSREDQELVGCLEQYMKLELQGAGRPDAQEPWEHVFPKRIVQQANGYDCGMFVFMYAKCRSAGRRFDFCQAHMAGLRAQLAFQLNGLHISWS